MKCEECGNDTDGTVCKNCGLVIDDRPIAQGLAPVVYFDRIQTGHDTWESPLIPAIRRKSKVFKPQYQKKYNDYIYIKAYETINKFCAQLQLPDSVKFEALNIFKGIRKREHTFFRMYKLGPTYLACIKIACRIRDFPISNYELSKLIDYQIGKGGGNRSYMEKKFNRAYRAIIRLYKLRIKTPEQPNFISYACHKLGLPYDSITETYQRYAILKKYFQPHFRIEGYILALIHIYRGVSLNSLEKTFHTSSKTIVNRRNEILKYASKEM